MKLCNRFVIGISAGLAALPAVVGAANTFVFGNVSSWTVRTDPEHAYRCFAEVLYEGGTSIRIGYNNGEGSLYLSVTDPSWAGIRPGSKHEAAVLFDDAATFELAAMGIATESTGVNLTIPDVSRHAFLQDFMARHIMSVKVEGSRPLDLSLAGSHRATLMLEECQGSMVQNAPAAN
jgi:hypothetical protein